ncbi:MAG: hypothetical protein LKK39_04600 [Oscillospiraceae bacterium]|nr:hypothetical protein [Oscillospiraceae bacterium]MCI2190946.1 hypothetical protein [Oscillospiraceae bacterium]MCI2205930.1 hypothetical protein [Oscillospiraceae bacterium]
MEVPEIIKALRRNMVDTGSLVCLGCGHEHNCSTHGCAIMREAADALEKLSAAPENKPLTVLRCQDCIKSEPFNGQLICAAYGGIWGENDGCTHGIRNPEGSKS